jgi:hypothetical protein
MGTEEIWAHPERKDTGMSWNDADVAHHDLQASRVMPVAQP